MAEFFLALVTAISGGGHLRITDVGRSKVLGADRSFILNGGVVAFGYAAGFKAQGLCTEKRLAEQLVALKQLVWSLSMLSINPYTLFSGSLWQPSDGKLSYTREANGDRGCTRIAPRPTGMQRSRIVARRQERIQRHV